MPGFSSITSWLNIRSEELRPLLLATGGAFLLLSFTILTRTLRESLFLANEPIEKLPLMTGAVVLISLPLVGRFSQLMGRYRPRRVLTRMTLGVIVGIIALWKVLHLSPWAIPALYVWTAVGSLLMASGFWMVAAEIFSLRGAKRLFSLISAGGTLGAMITGLSLGWLTQGLDLNLLVLLSTLPALLFVLLMNLLPGGHREPPPVPAGKGPPLLEAARTTWREKHLRLMAGIIFIATTVMTLVDFQFKDLAQARLADGAELASFLGAFYGAAGFLALLLQVFLAGRLLEQRGVGFSLAVPAAVLLAGGGAVLAFPTLGAITALRGADFVLRKSLFRPTMEVLFVSVPTRFRRLTKTFVDSLVDSAAEGFGSLLILLWLSWLHLPTGGLMAVALVLALLYLLLTRLMNRSYFHTITHRLQEEESRAKQADRPGAEQTGDSESQNIHMTGNLLRATFTNLDLSHLRDEGDDVDHGRPPADACPPSPETRDLEDRILAGLAGDDDTLALRTLSELDTLQPEHLALATRLMARDSTFKAVARLMRRFPHITVEHLVARLRDEKTDFVVRRRIPEILADVGGPEADDALLDALTDNRFEVRYRAAVALLARRRHGLPTSQRDWPLLVWHAISLEVRKDRPLWELQRLLDDFEVEDDDLITLKVGVRGELSLEHTFRLLSLVLDPAQVRAAYHGVIFDDAELKSFALEYLEMVLPRSIRERLWFYIGDVSEQRRRHQARPLDNVVADMMVTGQTLFGGELTRQALDEMVARRRTPPAGREPEEESR